MSPLFDAIAEFLSRGGLSLHCFDFILQGKGEAYDRVNAQNILREQARITGEPTEPPFEELLRQLSQDVKTFFLAPQGHHKWRSGRTYDDFPFHKVVSLQTVARLGK